MTFFIFQNKGFVVSKILLLYGNILTKCTYDSMVYSHYHNKQVAIPVASNFFRNLMLHCNYEMGRKFLYDICFRMIACL
jgi:hypothetical protein